MATCEGLRSIPGPLSGGDLPAIIQVFYEVPDDILFGLASGEMSRFGSVVRGATAIAAHLKEVQPPVAEDASVIQKIATAARNPKVVGVAAGAAAVTVVGGGAATAKNESAS